MFTILITTLLSSAFAKDPCAKLKPHTDAFGVTSRGIVQYVGNGGYLAVSLVETGDTVELVTMYALRGAIDEVVAEGTEGQVALDDGKVLTMATKGDAPPIANTNGSAIFTQWRLRYVVDAETLKALSAAPMSAVKSSIVNGPVSFEVPRKKARRIQTMAGCLAK